MIFGLREELGALSRPLLVDPCDVRHAHVEEPAGKPGLGRRAEADARLVVGGTAGGDQGQPGVGDLDDDRVALQQHLPAKQRLVELPGTVLVGDNKDMGDQEALRWRRKVAGVHAGNV